MKISVKIFNYFLLIVLLFVSGDTVYGKTVSVYDEAHVLSDEQKKALEEKYDVVRDKYNVDVSVAITENLYSDTAMESADDFYDYNGYGMGSDDDGILLYICLGTREYHITTHARAIDIFNENGIQYLQEQIVPYLKESDYYGAADSFISASEKLLYMDANGETYNKKGQKNVIIPVLIAIGISFAIAFLLTAIKLLQMKTANKKTYANDYMKSGSMNISYSNDIFLYSHINRREKPKSNSSSTHKSSSGRIHGGGGGRF